MTDLQCVSNYHIYTKKSIRFLELDALFSIIKDSIGASTNGIYMIRSPNTYKEEKLMFSSDSSVYIKVKS